MHVRATPDAAFPVIVCALAIPTGAKAISIDGAAVAPGIVAPKRIAVTGDTGCRLKGTHLQNCNDPAQWPIRQIARAIAAQKPDLIVHVGDYHYRETPCPGTHAGCAQSPYGDNWAAWDADFFAPAADLMPHAPWVFVRGNHEDCSHAGQGWSRILDPTRIAAQAGCTEAGAPFIVLFSNVTLAVLDVAAANEPVANAGQAEAYRLQYAALAKLAPGPIWVLQHRPIWSTGGTVAGLAFGDNKTLAAAAATALPSQVQLILSGHHHIFQVLSYVQDLPLQIVAGHGGNTLNLGQSADPAGWIINGVTVRAGTHRTGQFGFSMLELQSDGWVVTNFDQDGRSVEYCGLAGRQAACTAK